MAGISDLEGVGLGKHEARIYLAVIEVGPATISEIAHKSKLTRPTVYDQLKKLKQKGLVSEQSFGRQARYIAESPEKIDDWLESQQLDLSIKRKKFASVLNDFEISYNPKRKHRPVVRLFEGRAGNETLHQSYIKRYKAKEVLNIYDVDKLMDNFPNARDVLEGKKMGRRVKAGIRQKLIYTSKKGFKLPKLDPLRLRESKFVEYEKFPKDLNITIQPEIIIIRRFEPDFISIVIEDVGIASAMSNWFNLWWNSGQ